MVRVYDVVADALVAADVACLFGVMGEDTAPLVVAVAARGIRYYAARHENQAVAMADGYSRASGRTGVATVTGGPGVTNALTAINTAHRAGSRVLILTGAGRPAEDDLDPAVIRQSTVASWLKHFPHATALGGLGIEVMRPQSAQSAEADTKAAIARARRGTVVLVLARQLLLETAVQSRHHDHIADGWEPRRPEDGDIAALADALQETWAIRRPIILAGRGAAWSDAAQALAR
ncbi:MAG: thiamine pyrophosphate-binding protein, partial [Casimicrobiaceae bacterium]